MSNPNKKSTPIRIDQEFVKQMRSIISKRAMNFPEENPRELTDREISRMMRNTFGFEKSLKELEKFPRKKF